MQPVSKKQNEKTGAHRELYLEGFVQRQLLCTSHPMIRRKSERKTAMAYSVRLKSRSSHCSRSVSSPTKKRMMVTRIKQTTQMRRNVQSTFRMNTTTSARTNNERIATNNVAPMRRSGDTAAVLMPTNAENFSTSVAKESGSVDINANGVNGMPLFVCLYFFFY